MPTSVSPTIEPWLAAALSPFTVGHAKPTSTLDDLGVDSLSLIRVVLTVLGEDDDVEIDPAGLANLRTVADLQDWLAAVRVTTGDDATGGVETS